MDILSEYSIVADYQQFKYCFKGVELTLPPAQGIVGARALASGAAGTETPQSPVPRSGMRPKNKKNGCCPKL